MKTNIELLISGAAGTGLMLCLELSDLRETFKVDLPSEKCFSKMLLVGNISE